MQLSLEFFLLPAVFILGIITSYEDIKEGKIRNKWVVAALVYSFVGTFLFFAAGRLYGSYLIAYISNIIIILISGIILWKFGVWTSADAKLTAAYAALIPISIYKSSYTDYAPAFVIIVNTFAIFFLVFLLKLLQSTSLKDKIAALKDAFSLGSMLNAGIFVFGFSWPLRIVLNLLNIQFNMLVIILGLLLFTFLMQKFPKIDYRTIAIILSLLHLNFDYESIITVQFLINFAIILVVIVLLLRFILSLSFSEFSTPVRIESLKPGMLLAENVYYNKEKNRHFKMPMKKLFGRAENTGVKPLFKRVVTEKGMERLLSAANSGKLDFDSVRVYQTLPFAPLLFTGVLATLLAKGNMIVFAVQLIEKFL